MTRAQIRKGASVVSPVGPHAQSGFLEEIRVTIAEAGVETAAVALGDMAHSRVLFVRAVIPVGGAEAGVVPRVGLFQAPDFEDVGSAVADCDGACRVLDLSHSAAG